MRLRWVARGGISCWMEAGQDGGCDDRVGVIGVAFRCFTVSGKQRFWRGRGQPERASNYLPSVLDPVNCRDLLPSRNMISELVDRRVDVGSGEQGGEVSMHPLLVGRRSVSTPPVSVLPMESAVLLVEGSML